MTTLVILGMLAVPQAVGVAVDRLVSRFNARPRPWAWPIAAAAAFAVGWYALWSVPSRHFQAQGERVCGAAGALLLIPLVLFTPFNAILGAVLQAAVRTRGDRASG